MKQLSLATILCGTLIVLAPIIHSLFVLAMLTHLLAIDPHQNFNLHTPLNDSYQGWCLFIGICLFVVGVVNGFLSGGRRAGTQSAGDLPHSLAVEGHA